MLRETPYVPVRSVEKLLRRVGMLVEMRSPRRISMRGFVLSCVASCVVLIPAVGTAQVYSRPQEPPVVTAQTADWQIAGEPVFHAGYFYFPSGPSIFFNGNVMVRSGVY